MFFQNTQDRLVRNYSSPVEDAYISGINFFDFGNATVGTVVFTASAEDDSKAVVRMGEKLTGLATIDREPPGCIRHAEVKVPLKAGTHKYRVQLTPDERNTGPMAVGFPEKFGVVMPFQYCEIELCDEAELQDIQREEVLYPFDDEAASFECDNDDLNRVWELCKHTIKATSFMGLYIDGDRERIAYEADAYLNQLSHYSVDCEYDMARATNEYLLFKPTWPTEWTLHHHLMAWADYLYTGDKEYLEKYYDELKLRTLSSLAGENGLISTQTGLLTDEFQKSINIDISWRPMEDIVDWPPAEFSLDGIGERDGHEMMPFNTVVNAFYFNSLKLMSQMAAAIGRSEDAKDYGSQADCVRRQFNKHFFDAASGLYVDGVGSRHSSLHANMFAVVFGLTETNHLPKIMEFIKSRGMACSVYGAQYLLEALYQAGEADYAFELMTAQHDRGWLNMINSGASMTLEAWDLRYKQNLDWNHAWGAAPANIIPRCLVGFRPLTPGCTKIALKPQPSKYLNCFDAKIPTPHGPLEVHWRREGNKLEYAAPDNVEVVDK